MEICYCPDLNAYELKDLEGENAYFMYVCLQMFNERWKKNHYHIFVREDVLLCEMHALYNLGKRNNLIMSIIYGYGNDVQIIGNCQRKNEIIERFFNRVA